MKRLLVALMLVSAVARAADAPVKPASPFQALADAASGGIVTVRGFDTREKLLRSRPGFFVADAQVVTVRHPLVGSQRVDVILADGSVRLVTGVEAEDPAGDLVMLHLAMPSDPVQLGTAGKQRRALTWAPEPPKAGDLVVVVDDGTGDERGVTAGTLKPYKLLDGVGEVLAIDARVSPRREGSPVLNYDGQVVGVVSVGYDDGQRKVVAFVTTRLSKLVADEIRAIPGWSTINQAAVKRPADELYAVARAAVESGNLKVALARLEAAVMKAPGHQDAWLTLGVVKARLERWDEALECFERVVHLFRENVEGQKNLCLTLVHLERWKTARPPCEDACRLAPRDARLLVAQAQVTENLENAEAAINAYDRVLEVDPGNVDALYRKGVVQLATGRYPPAATTLQTLCKIDAGYKDALKRLGDALQGRQMHREAAEAYTRALKRKGPDVAVYTRLGQSWLALNQPGKALKAFEDAVRLRPSEPKVYAALGQSFTHLKKLDSAEVMFRQAVRLNDGYTLAWFELAELLRSRGKLDDARGAYEKVVTLDDRHVGGLYGLGLTFVALKKRDEAWDQVRRLEPLDALRARSLADQIIE